MIEKSSDLVFTGMKNNNYSVYGRNEFNEKDELQDKLKKIYDAKFSYVTSSGMNAISAIFHVYIRNKNSVNIVISDELYEDTISSLFYIKCGLLSANGLENSNVDTIDVSDSDNIINLFKKKYNNKEVLLFLESCTNPSSKIFDFNIIQILKKITKNKLTVVVDNTWLTGCSFNPFNYDVDIVVDSLTKYYSAGITISGAIITNNEMIINDVDKFMCGYGIHVSPVTCTRVSSMIDNMEERIDFSSYNTIKIIDFLKTINDVKIYHPSIETHPEYKFAKDNFIYYPSVFYIKFKKTNEEFMKWLLNDAKNIKYKTSYGSQDNKIDQEPGIDENGYFCCRISVSYKVGSYKDAISDLRILFPNDNL